MYGQNNPFHAGKKEAGGGWRRGWVWLWSSRPKRVGEVMGIKDCSEAGSGVGDGRKIE